MPGGIGKLWSQGNMESKESVVCLMEMAGFNHLNATLCHFSVIGKLSESS